jgi:hypothetical protein
MYANIPTDHAITIMDKWFSLHSTYLPNDFPRDQIIAALKILMRNNVFSFGNRYFLQANGTAMLGTSCACAYATIYYSYHEETQLMDPLNFPPTYLYARLIDDAIVILSNTPNAYSTFIHRMNTFASPTGKRLVWEATEPTRQVDFLDLTITLSTNGNITTKTYQKQMNLYLYRPPTSAQPTNILKGQIYGTIHKYHWQNTFANDFTQVATLLFHHLHRRGHSRRKLGTLFLQAAARLPDSHMPRSHPPHTCGYRNIPQ